MYKNNPNYKLELEHNGVRVYTPVNIMEGYSTQRYVEAMNQQIFSNSGATSDVLKTVMTEILERCNDDKNKEIRTQIGALAQSILYRLDHPVDMHCAIRMGAILSFIEEDRVVPNETDKPDLITYCEPEDKIETLWLDKKVNLAMTDTKFYDFFLSWGIANTPKYNEHLDTLNDSEYFAKRMITIQSLIPTNPYKK